MGYLYIIFFKLINFRSGSVGFGFGNPTPKPDRIISVRVKTGSGIGYFAIILGIPDYCSPLFYMVIKTMQRRKLQKTSTMKRRKLFQYGSLLIQDGMTS